MPPPTSLWTFTPRIFVQVRPFVHTYLRAWRERAASIPDPELRRQALTSIDTKTFHCEGGSIYALLAGPRYPGAIRFIVAYQTISDYLDNLCDRSTSEDPEDFTRLHTSLHHALEPGSKVGDYYRFRDEQDDGGYLVSLVRTCQSVAGELPVYPLIAPYLHELAEYYCHLQVCKHVREIERLPLMQAWYNKHKNDFPSMEWYEFAACCGSTVGIFSIFSYALSRDFDPHRIAGMQQAYFPWVQGLHILLDYLIDQDEDSLGGDLNFCSYYQDYDHMVRRLVFFYSQANDSIASLPHAKFHRLINQGMLGMYFADHKVYRQKEVRKAARKMILRGGATGLFFYALCWVYRRMFRSRAK